MYYPRLSTETETLEDSKQPALHVLGRYMVYDEVAAGGMATVHFGRLIGPAGFTRTVAIKRLHAQFAKDPEFVAMLLDEARLAARIRHPNVVATLDVVAAASDIALVMDYVQGESLARLLRIAKKSKQRIPMAVTSSVIADALMGLHAAHEATSEHGDPLHIVHRDMSPQNVMVGVDGSARVLDFGVAKAASRLQTTSEGQIKGKVAYMAPEQLRQKPLDRRADIFAAGIVLWELLVGDRLFASDDVGGSISMILQEAIPRPSSRAPGIPPAVDEVVQKALARSPDERFQTARQMASALHAAVPPATALDVGDWVESLAGKVLRERAARVAEIESGSSSSEPLQFPPSQLGMASSAASGVAATQAEATRTTGPGEETQTTSLSATSTPEIESGGSRWLLWAGLGAVVLALASVGIYGWRALDQVPPSAATRTAGRISAKGAETFALPRKPAPPVTSTKAAPPRPQPLPPKAKPPSPKKNCKPPYVIDDKGIQRFKPECF